MERYNPKKIETKWKRVWLARKIYEPDFLAPLEVGRHRRPPMRKRIGLLTGEAAKKPFYNLMMFPYPSAEGLHIGGVRTFTGVDIYGRFKRMQGLDVFEPIGLDGFGIHSENYALKIGKHPAKLAKVTEKNFYRQLSEIGNGFAWRERLETYDPDYYKWTQWIFIELFKHGLAYRKKAAVNWCPSCKTVLADEQVIAGKCERCSTVVGKRELEQWFFRITNYAERLLKNIEKIDWDEKVKIAQKNWIGRSEGALLSFPLKTKTDFVLLHGYNGSPERDFFPWLKRELLKRGVRVYAPQLPNPAEPNIEEQVDFLFKHHVFSPETVIITHSLGGVVAMKLLPRFASRIAGVVMVAPPLRTEFLDGKKRPALDRATDWKFDFSKIKQKANWITVIKDIGDRVVPHDQPEEIAEKLGAKLVEVTANYPHFNSPEEPVILKETGSAIEVFTTRPDTLFGATYMVVGPEHTLIKNFQFSILNFQEVDAYVKSAKAKSDEERIAEGKGKTGVELKGIKAINPANKEGIPVFVADYVLGNVGTGAIMAVPAHDERDFEFAKKFNLPVKQVIWKKDSEVRSYVMGVDDITPFEREGIIIKEKTTGGDYKVIIPDGKENVFEKLILEYMKLGFWNEYVGKETVFIFKMPDEKIERLILSSETNERINKLAGILVNEIDKRPVGLWLTANNWYTPVIVHSDVGIVINSGKFSGMDSEKAKWEITKFVGGERKVQYRLRDWLISRQRYWGPPIPMIFCDSCGWNTVPEEDLPVKLPFVKEFRPTGSGKSPLASIKSFYETKCPKCKNKARRETDVSDTFLDSAWYYIGYLMAFGNWKLKIGNSAFAELTRRWLPVNMYIGGLEHSVLHLLYSRFITMALHDFGFLAFEEPFTTFIGHGLITKDGAKMSKSKGNVVNPDEYIRAYGADAIRMYLAFLAPLTEGGDFRDSGIKGITRFLERVWRFAGEMKFEKMKGNGKIDPIIEKAVNEAVKKVTKDTENLQYNTSISALMVLINIFEEKKEFVTRRQFKTFLKLLAPFAPFLAEELWSRFFAGKKSRIRDSRSESGQKQFKSIHREPWPKYDEAILKESSFDLIIQVNGKVRGKISLPVGATEVEAREAALKLDAVKHYIPGAPKRIIFVPDKLINFVV